MARKSKSASKSKQRAEDARDAADDAAAAAHEPLDEPSLLLGSGANSVPTNGGALPLLAHGASPAAAASATAGVRGCEARCDAAAGGR